MRPTGRLVTAKKFLAEHESDILLHKAAKKYFDDVGIKSFPSMKSIDAEFAELLAKKKAAYMVLIRLLQSAGI